MPNKMLTTKLYETMFAEQKEFRDWLLSQPPEEILNHTYEHTMREGILLSVEYTNLSDRQCKALLKSPCPLADIFKDFEKRETDHMSDIWDIVESLANAVIQQDVSKTRVER